MQCFAMQWFGQLTDIANVKTSFKILLHPTASRGTRNFLKLYLSIFRAIDIFPVTDDESELRATLHTPEFMAV